MPRARQPRSSVKRSLPKPRLGDDSEAIRRFLRYLTDEAVRTRLPITAYLIELAEASIPRSHRDAYARPRAKR